MHTLFVSLRNGAAVASLGLALVLAAAPARAQSEASAALSMLPIASVVGGASVAGASAGAVLAVPAALSVGGVVLTVAAVESTARGTVVLLTRASDGAQVSLEVLGRAVSGAARGVAASVGAAVLVTVVSTGVVLSAAGEVLAYVPNALGRALLHNERL
ncbi:hypothetical protein ACFX58_08245 [Sphingomonas sp. NCPPB 2930]